MKKLLLIIISISFLGCSKSKIEKVVFSCTGGSGDYTMTYTSLGNVIQGNYSAVTYMLDEGQYGYANAFDNSGATFTMNVAVDGVVVNTQSGLAVGMNYTNQ